MLSNDSKILTPKGWKTHGDVVVGDVITDPETGGSQRIVGVYPQGELDLYRVTFDDGASVLAGLEHLWMYKLPNRRRPRSKPSAQRDFIGERFGENFESSGRYANFRVDTTEQMLGALSAGHAPRIPLCAPVLFDVNGRTGTSGLDPYLIGQMLGDGNFSLGKTELGGFRMTTADEETWAYLSGLGFVQSSARPYEWYLSYRGSDIWALLRSWSSNNKMLCKAGKDKFIPAYVFTANIEYRLAVLQGLLDSDGSVDDRGHIEFCNISDALCFGVADLVRSFGGKATVSEPITGKYVNKAREIVECQTYRRVYIWSKFASALFRLQRKRERCTDSWNGGYENMRRVRSIELSHKGEATCIKVSSPHGLYVTDDYIVTHNTDCAIGRQICGALEHGHKWNGLFIRKSYKYFAELRRRIFELIRMGLPAELKGSAQSTNYLRFANGAQVMLTVIESMDKAEFFQGQQFCVAEGTLIRMADGTGREIERVVVGDMVATLEGPRRVTRAMPARVSPCVRVETPFGEQEHPTDHPIFSVSGWRSYSSVLGSGSRGAERSSQESAGPLSVCVDAVFVPQIADRGVFQGGRSSGFRVLQGFLKRLSLSGRFLCRRFSFAGVRNLLHRRLFSRFPDFLWHCFSRARLRVLLGGAIAERVLDFRRRCSFDFRQCGERVRLFRGFYRGTAPSRGGVDRRSPGFSSWRGGDPGSIRGCIPLNLSRYEHPYSGRMREVLVETFSGACRMTPCGDRVVYDLTVDEANHYISHKTCLVNKNTEISIEEACQFSFIDDLIEKLKGCMRSPHGLTTRMFLTANPGGPGHNQVKARFMPYGVKPGQIMKDDNGMTSVFIPSSVEDNKILCENDPEYVALLRSIKDPVLRRAWLDGDWDVVLGGFFSDIWNKFQHVVPFFRPPTHWPRIVSMDWGSSTPFSIGWYAVSDGETSIVECGGRVFPKNALVRFYEWYGCPKGEANVGLKMTSTLVATRMLELEDRKGLLGCGNYDRVADPSIFAEKDGPSIAEKFASEGVVWRRAENRRISGWDQVRSRLRGRCIDSQKGIVVLPDGSTEEQVLSEKWEPMLYVTENCTQLIRTLPIQERDETDWEDVDTDGEDHACLALDTEIFFDGDVVKLTDVFGKSGTVVDLNGNSDISAGAAITRLDARVVRLVMEDGETVVCTPDHRFFARDGWKRCDTLISGDELRYVDINNQQHVEKHNAGLTQGANLYWKRVARIEHVYEKSDVGCLYVPRTHSFALASGLVSRNCDELRYCCMSRPSGGVSSSAIEKPRQLTECELDFALAQSAGAGIGVVEGLSVPNSFGIDSSGPGYAGTNVYISR